MRAQFMRMLAHQATGFIPEMFNKTKITVDKIIKLTLSAIIKRKLLGIHYGTVVVAEGVFHDLDSDDLKGTGVHMTYDEHGHPELGKISKAVLFNDILEKEFSKLGWKVKTRPVEILHRRGRQSKATVPEGHPERRRKNSSS